MPTRQLIACLALAGLFTAAEADAQGLIWNLPADGSWVRYEGTYSQLVRRPDSAEGDLQLQWTRHLTIKSVGTAEEAYQGEVQRCRWLEFKVVTAQQAAVLEPGPGGEAIYKILVPERSIRGQVNDESGIIVSYLPIVRGYRRLGGGEPESIESGVFEAYPVVSFLRHYRDLQAESAGPEQVDVPLGAVSATAFKGAMTMESTQTRSTNEATLWRSDDVPFGLAKWVVRDVREEKHPSQSRDQFRETMEVSVEMSAHASGTDAATELDVP
ncbi:MAG: hypothetical protein AB7U20_15375 [Planctomycetaceae bacterium]